MMKFRKSRNSQSQIFIGEIDNSPEKVEKTKRAKAFAWSEGMLPFDQNGASVVKDERRSLAAILMIVGVVAITLMLISRLFYLQIVEGARYRNLANGNRIREKISYAPRGNIYDRNGVLLATNTITSQLSVTPYLLEEDENERQEDFQMIAKFSGLKIQKIKQLSEAEGNEYPLPLPIKDNLNHKQSLSLRQILPETKGFSLDEVPTRVYRSEAALAHVIGYVGRVSDSDLDSDKSGVLLPVDYIGKAGIEKSYDLSLRGVNGIERTEVDALGRPVRVLARQPSKRGQDIHLAIDYKVQKRLAREMKKQMKESKTKRSSGVVVDSESGAIRAMVSLPSFNNNLFVGGISNKQFKKFINNSNQPLINKVVQGGFTTGSTIKPVVASAALEEKVVTPQTIIVDRGAISYGSFIFRGWRPEGLGPMNVRSALAWSSNIYFYTVGGGHGGIKGLGGERLSKYYRMFGFGEPTGIDLPDEFPGRVPDEAWKLKQKGEPWYIGDSYNISIGQGDFLATPLQLTLADMSIANGGYLLKPYLVEKIGEDVVGQRTVRREVKISKKNLQIVREGMRQVLTGGTTCECTFSDVPYKVAGKSGTAQTTSNDDRRPHAWYTAFAPFKDPEIMSTVMIEEGSGGSLFAAPAIAGAMETYFKKK
jgi:penicillin-binding protein 2